MGKTTRCFQAALDRLAFHNLSGGILDGFHITTDINKRVNGKSDFPNIQIFLPSVSENREGTLIVSDMRINMIVAVWHEVESVGLLTAMEKVSDALVTTHDGKAQPDRGMAGTAYNTALIKYGTIINQFSEMFALETSLNAQLTIELKTMATEIAQRRI